MNENSHGAPPFLVDSHCHLDFPDFSGALPDVITRAREAGVARMVTICTRVRQFNKILAIAEAHEEVFCSVGTHPHNADEEPDVTAADLITQAGHPKVVAIGEAGLDYHYDNSSRDAQARSLRVQIEAARQTGLPLVIHARDADQDMENILTDEMGKGSFGAVLHCFSSGRRLAEAGIELGFFVSFSGILTFKKSGELREIAKALPLERLLVETDAPYLAPVPCRGRCNEPAFVRHTAAVLGEVLGLNQDETSRITSDNFFRCFSKVPDPRKSE